MNETLCWICKKATNNGCSWSRRFLPVDGWDAEEHVIRGRKETSYLVKDCPEYIKDDGEIEELDNEGVLNLGMAVLRSAATDYDLALYPFTNTEFIIRKILQGNDISEESARSSLEKFFVGDYADGLSDMNPVYIMDKVLEKNKLPKSFKAYKAGAKDCFQFIKKTFDESPICRKCNHFHMTRMQKDYGWCEKKSCNVMPDDFCKEGEK